MQKYHIQLIQSTEGNPLADSREVASIFGKDHKHVLRDIDVLISQAPEALSNFGHGYYKLHNTGEQQHRCVFMNRTGFTLLAMGFTGAAAIKWKLAYIQAFDAMEAALRNQEPAKQLTEREALRAALDGWDAADAARLEAESRHLAAAKQVADLSNQNVGLAQELYTTREIAAVAKDGIFTLTALLGTPDGICLRDAANQLEQPQHEFNVWLHKKGGWIYRSGSRSNRWKPHASAIAKGWLGDKQYIRPKDSATVSIYTDDMGPVDTNLFYLFREVEITPAGMVRILQYDDHPNPNAPALRIKRQELRFKSR